MQEPNKGYAWIDRLNDAKLSAVKNKFDTQISSALSTPMINALKSKSMGSSNLRVVAALHGLAMILQSKHKLWSEIVEVATCNELSTARHHRPMQVDAICSLGIEVLSLSCSVMVVWDALILCVETLSYLSRMTI